MQVTVANIEQALRQALPQAAAAPTQQLAAELHAAWSEPPRHYHSLQHLSECLNSFAAVSAKVQDIPAVLLALLFHDAVYDPQRHDNEARSAEWAVAALPRLGASTPLIEAVCAMVMATQTHRVGEGGDNVADAALLLDIDLAILGSSPARFAEYETQIRREYAFVPDAQYATARQQVMRGFAQRDPLYLTVYFQQTLHSAAKRNLASLL